MIKYKYMSFENHKPANFTPTELDRGKPTHPVHNVPRLPQVPLAPDTLDASVSPETVYPSRPQATM